ncbi:MAG: bacillithiol system redox-active protein YtxJ [Gemmatimonadota bacterium]
MKTIRSLEALDRVLARDRVLLYKHSTRCGLSTRAQRQIRRFMENFPAAPVYLVDVIADRSVSDAIEARLGIRHETPQAILVEDGDPLRDASHRGVRADVLTAWWEREAGSR